MTKLITDPWIEVDEASKYGVAIYNFYEEGDHKLSLDVGDPVNILCQCQKWYYGFAVKNRDRKGIFPTSYVSIRESIVDVSGAFMTILPKELPIVHEITAVLREWGSLWKELYLHSNSNKEDFKAIQTMMIELIDWRRLIMCRKLTVDELTDLQQKITNKIDMGNAKLGLDLVVRDDRGNIIDPMRTSTINLYRLCHLSMDRIGHQLATKRMEEEKLLMEQHAPPKKLSSFNLYVNVKNFVCRIGENADILLTLYDAKDNQFFSDNYIMKWGSQGVPKDLDLMNNLRVIFTDLSSSRDAQRERVFLVCQIIRVGRMDLKEPDSKKHTKGMRRPFGVAAIDVTDLFKGGSDSDEEKQYFIPFLQCTERDFMEATIKKATVAKDINHKGQGLWVTMRKLLGDFAQVQKDYPHLVTSSTSIARKMGFPDVILPGDVRNDIYITLMQGEFRRGSKMADKNVEVTISVCNQDGEVIPNVISEGAGGEMVSHYHSVIYYHEDKPRWMETIKLAIPINEFYTSHLKFVCKHRSTLETKDRGEKPFAMSFIKLMNNNGTTLSDTIHDLLVYRMDSKKSEDGPSIYFTLPSTSREQQRVSSQSGGSSSKQQSLAAGSLSLNVADTLQISTLVCSTKLTHNVTLMGLLKWRDNPTGLEKNLRSFMTVDGEEIVKFLQDTLDALFNILMENSECDLYDTLVFDALVFLVGLVSDRKYSHFKPVLDVYISETFSATLAYTKLVVVLKHYLEMGKDAKVDALLRTMKSIEYIFKFIVRSRMLFAALNDNRERRQHFEASLCSVFDILNHLMGDVRDSTVVAHEAVLTYLPTIIADFIAVYNPLEFCGLLIKFTNSIPADRVILAKMGFINSIVHSPLFLMADTRKLLLPVMLSHVDVLMSSNLELPACIKILSDIMDLLFKTDIVGSTSDDMTTICMTSLRTVIQTVIMINPKSSLIGSCVAVMTSILRQMSEVHYKLYLDQFETSVDLTDFLMEILTVVEELIRSSVYPPDWNEMILLQNWVVLKALRYFSNTIRDKFTSPFQFLLWMRFFRSALTFVTQPSLQLEHFSVNKRNKIISRYRDMRRETSFEIRSLWYNLGQHKVEFIPEIIGSILEMTLIPETELRRRTIPIFFDMMQCEFMSPAPNSKHAKKNFNKFEQEMIIKLDMLVTGGHGDEQYQEMFYEVIKSYCEGHVTMREQGMAFVHTVKQLMQLLLEYRAVVASGDSRDSEMCCTVSLLNFYHDIQRSELYIQYLNKLYDLHIECDNFTEAAYTLLQHSKLIRWTDEPLPQMLISSKYPEQQTHRELKEQLYYDVIKNFDQGKMWEMGIELCKELTLQYETDTFDYSQLSSILRKQADLYDSIMTKIRPEQEYFRVAYYGMGFPSFLQNRVFIYRGKEYERHGDFVARLQNQFPNAQLMKTLNPPTENMRQSLQQYLQINKVTPVMELKEQLAGKKLSEQILKYYKVNSVQKFTYSRRKDDNTNDVSNMWVERTILVTTFPLPGILKWFPVTSTSTFNVSPLELATETLDETNQKIKSQIDQHMADPSLKVDPLGMILNGVVDAAVNGGIANYKIFYSDDYLKTHGDQKELIQKLRNATALQLMILKKGLEIHRSKVHEALQPFHAHMEERYREMKGVLEREYGIKLTDEDYSHQDLVGMSAAALKRVQSMPASRHMQGNFVNSRFASTDKPLRILIHHANRSKPDLETPSTATRVSHVTSSSSFSFSSSPMTPGSDPGRVANYTLRPHHKNTMSQAFSINIAGDAPSTPTTTLREKTNSALHGSTSSIASSSSSSKTDRDSGGTIELNQQLATLRPRRPDTHRPTSDTFKPAKQPAVSPVQVSPTAHEPIHTDADDEAPPPLPEKSMHSDYANVDPISGSRISLESDDRPPLTRRITHRDRPQLPLPTTPTLKNNTGHFFQATDLNGPVTLMSSPSNLADQQNNF